MNVKFFSFILRALSALSVCCCAVPAFALGADAAGTVAAVNFYPSGAKFTYNADSDGQFEFSIPGAFDENSVRCLTLERLTSLKVTRVAIPDARPEELAAYEDKLDGTKKTLAVLESRASAIKDAIKFFAVPYGTQDAQSAYISDAFIAFAKNAYKARLDFEAELVDVNMSAEKARREYEDAKREYEDANARLTMRKGALPDSVIEIRGTTDGPDKLTFEAFTAYAGWNVVYEMNMDSARASVDAKMNAVAWQHTGIEIDGEALFNTRQPSYSVAPPDVRPLTVGIRQKNMEYALAESPPIERIPAPEPMAVYDESAKVLNKSTPSAIASLANVSVTGRGKIGGDGSSVRVKLGEFEMKCNPLIVSVPEQNREAWIVASIDVIPDAFLPGLAELSVDNAATGQTQIAESVTSVRIPFGMASRVTAKKKPYIRETGSSWIGTGVQSDGYTLEITNGMETEREVTVMDRIPLPTVDKVTLDVKKIDPKPLEHDKENKLTWKIKLAPGETKKITVEYTIKYPGDETLEYR